MPVAMPSSSTTLVCARATVEPMSPAITQLLMPSRPALTGMLDQQRLQPSRLAAQPRDSADDLDDSQRRRRYRLPAKDR